MCMSWDWSRRNHEYGQSTSKRPWLGLEIYKKKYFIFLIYIPLSNAWKVISLKPYDLQISMRVITLPNVGHLRNRLVEKDSTICTGTSDPSLMQGKKLIFSHLSSPFLLMHSHVNVSKEEIRNIPRNEYRNCLF